MSKKVFVCCPGDAETGGPEVLHQLVDALRSEGVNAYILYFPFRRKFTIPDAYKNYNIQVANYSEDYSKDSIVVIPEPVTKLMKFFKDSQICIWWLSVDNYYGAELPLTFAEKMNHMKMIIKGKRKGISSLKKYTHLVQSEYARSYLEKFGIESSFLTDYLNEVHLKNVISDTVLSEKENIVAYNPRKGVEITNDIIKNSPGISFVPIEKMTPLQVKSLLGKSKVYIDFGGHPGKDRFPREAAMAGCCIITGMRGSAKNNIDIPTASEYKIKDYSLSRNKDVTNIILQIFDDFPHHFSQFKEYRKSIFEEKLKFKIQVKAFVDKYCK
ncbi:hypothetical protein IG612_04190 [Pectobacterium sp. FL60-S17]|uniref:hypothetical protein n=1 Tax=Pectobacterium quasiaquaticum TaxID=2774015 RepID=UPI0018735A6F|nr:hypothetical protein [Pectobacterium quasiaquaticum]MBE5201827.1 hypothetical protein [Pectobacterium quasiaquaticum]MBE5210142.1 hypothetical protein [Pectobacterium quasiaquaticum]MBE5223321.1 hypothetical protein [Pectobacterium quasiaquaticum]